MRQLLASLIANIAISTTTTIHALPQPATPDSTSPNPSTITKIAAIGDSYSSGIGAGTPLLDPGALLCRRYSHAYPVLVATSPFLTHDLNPSHVQQTFQFLSCSGALLNDVFEEQIPQLAAGQDVIMLSAGGKDALLVDILNQCVYQLFAPTKEAARKMATSAALAWIPGLAKYARSCEEVLEDSESVVDGAGFAKELDMLLAAAVGKLAEGGHVYFTGYAKFWSEEMVEGDQCSGTSWSIFLSNADKWAFQEPVKLTVARRKRMNDLVAKVNSKIADAVRKHSDKATFIDYDTCFNLDKGRFCEPGVTEPDMKRPGLKFYELDISDPLGISPLKRSATDSTTHAGTFDNDLSQLAYYANAAGSTLNPAPDAQPAHNLTNAPAPGSADQPLPNPLPNGYGRIFHPQISGHRTIANLILSKLAAQTAQIHGVSLTPQDLDDTCAPSETSQLQPQLKHTNYTCPLTRPSKLPFNVFAGMYAAFCAEAGTEPTTSMSWHVDSRGRRTNDKRKAGGRRGTDGKQHGERKREQAEHDRIGKEKVKKRGLLTPPPDPDRFLEYDTELVFEPAPDGVGKGCEKSCDDAFAYLVDSPCGHTAAQQNIMAMEGRVDVGCGTYGYVITPP